MWKDGTNVVLGLRLAVSPWLIGGAAHAGKPDMVWNCVISGLLVALFALWACL